MNWCKQNFTHCPKWMCNSYVKRHGATLRVFYSHSKQNEWWLYMSLPLPRGRRDFTMWISYSDRDCTGQPVWLEEALANHMEPDPSWLCPPAVTRSALRRASRPVNGLSAGRVCWGCGHCTSWRLTDFLYAHMPQECPGVSFVVRVAPL